VNPLAGAIQSVDLVSTVSPNYAAEVLTEADGMGLHVRFAERDGDLVGIRNGIDVRAWDPETDEHTAHFSVDHLADKQHARAALLERVGWEDTSEPIVIMITRLVEQKGVDLAFEAARFLHGMKARMIVLGSGDLRLADWARWLQGEQPDHFWFLDGYDVPLSHQMFAGADLLLMPSQFEPCGLAQMQAMAYGTIPIVTAVGGLVDTVIDADISPKGNGFIATTNDESGIVDAMHRALRAVRHAGRKKSLQRRGMTTDWSWAGPAQQYIDAYRQLMA
jgi:starch synthase